MSNYSLAANLESYEGYVTTKDRVDALLCQLAQIDQHVPNMAEEARKLYDALMRTYSTLYKLPADELDLLMIFQATKILIDKAKQLNIDIRDRYYKY